MRRGLQDGRLTFGKHRGLLLTEVPMGYLGWLLEEDIATEYGLTEVVTTEMRRRLGGPPPVAVTTLRLPPSVSPEAVRLLVDTGYRAAALQYHPDRGGDTGRMQQINAAAAWLREQLRG
jgi:hypothetical protein